MHLLYERKIKKLEALDELSADGVTGGAEVVVTFARVDAVDGPRAPLLEVAHRTPRFDAAVEDEVSRRAGDLNARASAAVLMTHLVTSHIRRARRDADDAEVVVAVARLTLHQRVVVRPFLTIGGVPRVTAKHLMSRDDK